MSASSHPPRHLFWNRMMLNAFWVMLIAKIVCKAILYRPPVHPLSEIITSLYMPDLLILCLMLGLEAINRLFPERSKLFIIAGSYLWAILAVDSISHTIHIRVLVMLVPLLVSMIYLNIRYLVAATLVSILVVVYWYAGPAHQSSSAYAVEGIIVAFIFAGVALTGFGVISRGTSLLRSLEHSLESEQNLRIQNIIMDRLSKIDPLTDLYNHKTFHEYLGWLIDHQQSNPFPMHLAILDIDNFKKVNDSYGHWVGDIALKQVAAELLRQIGTDDFAARYGGEEFAVILTAKSAEEARVTMERIREGIAQASIAEMGGNTVTVSIGMHEYCGTDTKSQVFQSADDALYEAKKSGKNKVIVH